MKWPAISRRSAAPMPSISSRNSTLPRTVRHGSRPKFWNTMQASLRAPVTGTPAMVMRPSSDRDEPGGEPKQGGLAATARPEQRDELTLSYRRIDAVERHHQF